MDSYIYLDIGNSNAKWKFEDEYFEVPTNEFNLEKLPKSSKIWVSNVSSNFTIKSKSFISLVKSQKKYKSLINSYLTPHLLGSDRWLAMIAAYEKSPQKGFVVLDIGTAITVDYVNNIGAHQGGLIFPGLAKIRNTIDQFQIKKVGDINNLGQSTEDAWSKGTLGLIVTTVNEKIRTIKQYDPQVKILVTGGGLSEIEEYFEFTHKFHKNLVLDGLELFANNVG